MTTNPTEARNLVNEYLAEIMPFFEDSEKARYNELARILDEETNKTYVATPVDGKVNPRRIYRPGKRGVINESVDKS